MNLQFSRAQPTRHWPRQSRVNSASMIVAATHGLLLVGARAKLQHPAVRAAVTERDWPQLHVVSIAPLLASALARFLADGATGDLC